MGKNILKKRAIYIIVAIGFILINYIIANNTRKDGQRYVFQSDQMGYYTYLPSIFIYNDLNTYAYGRLDSATGNMVNVYPIGTAILESPFFFLAHAIALQFDLEPTGFSKIYQNVITIGTIIYAFLALMILFKILNRSLSVKTSLISVIIVYFGTNLYHYTVGDSGMSHAYSFFCISVFIYALLEFLKKQNFKNSLIFGLSAGLMLIIRPTNALFLFSIPFINIKHWKEIPLRIQLFLKSPYTLLIIALALLAISPQLIYWKIQSGQWVYYSYTHETFSNWSHPPMLRILFGKVSGLFIYSVLLILFFPGLWILYKRTKNFNAFMILGMFIVLTYINASWWAPTFDCSFGHRAFIEIIPFLVFPIAYFIDFIMHKRIMPIAMLIIAILLFINMRFSYLYKKHPCWHSEPDWGLTWTWKNVAYTYAVALYIMPSPKYHFLIIDNK